MTLSVSNIVLAAKRHEIAELKALQARARLVGVIGHMVHVLQAERGASSIYLASAGGRFEATRQQLIAESDTVERLLRDVVEEELEAATFSNAKIHALVAWVILGLDALPELRNRIANLHLAGHESVSAFSRLIAGLIALIFEVADATVAPTVSRLLVSLFNLVEAKELAGQERAVGALLFASGKADAALLERVLLLCDAQERNVRLFLEFAEAPAREKWEQAASSTFVARLGELRDRIREVGPDGYLDPKLSDAWFDSTSKRITAMWDIQRAMVQSLQKQCAVMIEDAERALSDSTGLLRTLRESPPARANAIDRFFDPAVPIEQSLNFDVGEHQAPGQAHSLIEVLQQQSQHLAAVESELESARRALAERKIIERAKGVLMARAGIAEDEAYKRMRRVSMDRNLRLVEVADMVLAAQV